MLQAPWRRLREVRAAEVKGEEIAEGGFTLIELMVVLLIIAILLAIAIPTFLGVTNTAGDRAAQSNLTNALTEAKALYEVNQSYSQGGAGYTPAVFTSQAPEFTWQTTACSSSTTNCISFMVVDASTAGDGQGVVLASYSAKTSTCWYVVDLESTPLVLLSPGFDTASNKNSSTATSTANAVATAGVYYGKSPPNTTTCIASTGELTPNKAFWASSYTNAGIVS
jgi:prepilin-type N-terminal cleavage/methylation domain-containing protein